MVAGTQSPDQVELLAMLPSVLQNLDRLSPSLSEELGEALSGHRLTVERRDMKPSNRRPGRAQAAMKVK